MSEHCTCATSWDGSCEVHDQINALKARLEQMRAVARVFESERDALAARLAEAEAALHKLMEAADDSDGVQYGTLGTTFVRDLCRQGLRTPDSASGCHHDGWARCWKCGEVLREQNYGTD